MTRASSRVVTVKEHRFEVPEDGDMKDLGIALHWAKQKASDLGLDIEADDWARISLADDSFAIVIIERSDD